MNNRFLAHRQLLTTTIASQSDCAAVLTAPNLQALDQYIEELLNIPLHIVASDTPLVHFRKIYGGSLTIIKQPADWQELSVPVVNFQQYRTHLQQLLDLTCQTAVGVLTANATHISSNVVDLITTIEQACNQVCQNTRFDQQVVILDRHALSTVKLVWRDLEIDQDLDLEYDGLVNPFQYLGTQSIGSRKILVYATELLSKQVLIYNHCDERPVSPVAYSVSTAGGRHHLHNSLVNLGGFVTNSLGNAPAADEIMLIEIN